MSALRLVIIGAGPGGYSAAVRARQLGAQVVLVEKDKVGGTCLNMGCIPSKIMRHSADMAKQVRDASAFGVVCDAGPVSFRVEVLRARQKKIIDDQSQGLNRHFKQLGIQLVSGRARVEEPGTIVVENINGAEERFNYDHLLIATGSLPGSLPGLPIDGEKIISSDQALWLEELPESLLVVGGGVIGCELAQIYHDLGVKVTIVEMLNRMLPLPAIDEEISKVYMRSLKKAKLPFYVGHTLAQASLTPGGVDALIKPAQGGEGKKMQFAKVLISIGRGANVAGMGLSGLGVGFDHKGWVEADQEFRTSAENVWAVGDCLGPARVMLAHVATAEAMCAVENMFGAHKSVDYGLVPSAVFTAPEIGAVGLTLAAAQEKYPGSYAKDFLFRQLGKAQAMGETDGLTRLVVEPSGIIVGGHIIGPCATSLVAELAVAITNKLSAEALASTIHAHPTLPEGIWEAALSAVGRPLHGV